MLKLSFVSLLLLSATAAALVPAPTAAACPITPESDPCGPPCALTVNGVCVVREPCIGPCPESQPYPGPGPVCAQPEVGGSRAYVTVENCTHAHAWACVPPWYGGRGLLGGLACRERVTLL